jgi:protein involved in polysaccharide export with SLBB domain
MFRVLGASVSALAVAALVGCGGNKYAASDSINPEKPFVFPGQLPPSSVPAATTNVQPGAPQNTNMGPMTPVGVSTGGAASQSAAVLRPGDRVTISFSDIPQPPQPFEVRIPEDGKITLPYNITVQTIGKTANQLQEEIRNAYVPKYFVRMTVTIKAEERFYFVGGEVRAPARVPYGGDLTVLRAIDSVGGFTDFAKRKKIELRRANGQTHMINWYKAIENPKLDLPVYPNDQITVHKKGPLGF